jgi:hypothetical protein
LCGKESLDGFLSLDFASGGFLLERFFVPLFFSFRLSV